MTSSTPEGSEARSSEAASSNSVRTCTGRTRASRRRPNVRMLSIRSRPRSAAASYLVDMLCRLGSRRELRLDHLRIAENGADDVVEVVRNPACQRSDHLHAARPFQPRRESRPVALEKLALDGIGHRIAGEPHHGQRENPVRCRPEGVEPHDASHSARSDQPHAGPGADAGGREHVLHCAGRQGGDIRHGDDVGSGRAEPLGQGKGLIGPARRIRRSVRAPSVHSGGVLIQHHIAALHADRPAELAEHLLQPRIGFRRRAVDQARRVLGNDMLECRPLSQRKGAGTQPQAETHEHDEQQQRDQVQQQPKSLRRRLDGGLAVGELCTHLFERLPARHGDEGLQRFVDRGQELMQQAGMREQRLCGLGVRSGRRALAPQTGRSVPGAP